MAFGVGEVHEKLSRPGFLQERIGRGEAVCDVIIVPEHVVNAGQRKTRQREVLSRHAIGSRALAARPQQERQHQAEGKRDVESMAC